MKRYSVEERRMWLEDWRGSGKSAWAYAKENGINPQTFMNWTKQGSRQALVEIPAEALPTTGYVQEIIIEKGEMRVHVPLPAGQGELRSVIEAVWGMS